MGQILKPEPQKLDEREDIVVYFDTVYHGKESQGIHLDYVGADHFSLTATQALSLLGWLLKQKQNLEMLAKERDVKSN